MQGDELRETSARRRSVSSRPQAQVSAYVVAVPTYVGGLMTLGIAAKHPSGFTHDVTTIRQRAEAQGVTGTSSYWTPEIHVGSFTPLAHLPPYAPSRETAKHLG